MKGPLPLSGLRVLDLSRLLPGPFLTVLLADLGAEVIKVEAPGGGDWVRYVPPLHQGTSLQFIGLNRGKRSLGLDLKAKGGVEIFKRLVGTADVIVESSRPGVMDRLGVGYAALSSDNPRLVFAALTGYGQTGPYRDRAGHDLDYMALSGAGARTGTDAPLPLGLQVGDIAGSLFGAIGILAALYGRASTGRGRFVDVSLTEGALAFNTLTLPVALGGLAQPRGRGILDGAMPGYRYYETQDGRFLAVAPLEPKFWASFCGAVGRPDWLPRHHGDDSITVEIATLIKSKTRAEWAPVFANADACVEPVLELDELDGHPLHAARRQFFDLVQGGAPVRQARSPVLDPEHTGALRPAPGLGQHTREVLRERGFTDGEIAAAFSHGALHGE